jgi:hypothetical protein
MEKEVKYSMPKWTKTVLVVTFTFYIWFLISTLLLPLGDFINLPEGLLLTVYNLIDFPISVLGFIICISIFSSLTILLEFREQENTSKIFLIEGFSFMLYFIIPIIATMFLLVLVSLQLTGNIPTETRISNFLEDLFLFTTTLFILTSILNIATQKFLRFINCCPTKVSKKRQKCKNFCP